MKKRLAGILLSCILAVSLTACGGGSDNSAAAADSTTASATTEVGGKGSTCRSSRSSGSIGSAAVHLQYCNEDYR